MIVGARPGDRLAQQNSAYNHCDQEASPATAGPSVLESTAETSARPMTLAEWTDRDEDEPGEFVDGRIVEDEEIGAEHEDPRR
jgi:hypothetical protein